MSWQRATPEYYHCMVLRSDQQLPPGQIQKCELNQGIASLWNELMPRLKQLSAAGIKGEIGIGNTDSRLGQGERGDMTLHWNTNSLHSIRFWVADVCRLAINALYGFRISVILINPKLTGRCWSLPHSPPLSAEVKNEWSYTTVHIHGFMERKVITLLSHGVGRWRPS